MLSPWEQPSRSTLAENGVSHPQQERAQWLAARGNGCTPNSDITPPAERRSQSRVGMSIVAKYIKVLRSTSELVGAQQRGFAPQLGKGSATRGRRAVRLSPDARGTQWITSARFPVNPEVCVQDAAYHSQKQIASCRRSLQTPFRIHHVTRRNRGGDAPPRAVLHRTRRPRAYRKQTQAPSG